MIYSLQTFCWPSDNNIPIELYYRHTLSKHFSFTSNAILFNQNSQVFFDTFFNAFNVKPWKKYCKINDLSLVLQGKGNFIVRIGWHRLNHPHTWLMETTIDLNRKILIHLPFWETIDDGMLYCSLLANSDALLTGGGFVTSSEPLNDVKLGMIITHFNRKQYVLPAIERIKNELLSDSRYKEKIDLIVVDNSQNIHDNENFGVTVIPNKNLGGSGGFTRGLLHLKDEGNFTHCLFMDDDATCEIESIRRTFAILQYSNTNNLAIAGSLLSEMYPYRLIDKAAKFNGECNALKAGLDMRVIDDLLDAEEMSEKPDYGGWWFFAFNIDMVNFFPFPFFVRGDDSLFGLMNKFDIVTMNGIATWGEDFVFKRDPFTVYLDTRYHLLHAIQYLNFSLLKILFYVTKFSLAQLLSYDYASGRSVTLALTHIMKGPKFWIDNLDVSTIRAYINDFQPTEKMIDIATINSQQIDLAISEKTFPLMLQLLTLNGFLLPSFFLKNKIIMVNKSQSQRFRKVFGHKNILYFYPNKGKGYYAKHDKILFFKELFSFIWQAIKFSIKAHSLKKEYQDALPYLTSENFWREIYKLNKDEK